jgi:hypothetical protein
MDRILNLYKAENQKAEKGKRMKGPQKMGVCGGS